MELGWVWSNFADTLGVCTGLFEGDGNGESTVGASPVGCNITALLKGWLAGSYHL